MAPTLTPQQFVDKWRPIAVKERSGYQEHFIDLCRLVGHPTPLESDSTAASYGFEAGADKQKGGRGWADVWKRGFFALEYKGKEANLDKAYQQLLQYRESLQNPPLLVVSDMERILVHTNFTNTVKQVYEITYDALLTPAGLQRLRDMFFAPEAFRVAVTSEQVTQEAARQFAHLADHLRRWKHEPAAIAHFLIRLLFCLFAEDAGLLPAGLFSRLVDQTRRNSAAFSKQLRSLFAEMASGGWFGPIRSRTSTAACSMTTASSTSIARPSMCWSGSASWTGRRSSRPSSARCSSARSTRPSARSSAPTTPARRISC
jgi:hypothetical protein